MRRKNLLTRMIPALAVTLVVAGCGDLRVFRNPGPRQVPPAQVSLHGEPVYRLGCPDVLRVIIKDRPGFDMLASIDVDGQLPLGESVGSVRLENRTLAEAREAVAHAADTTQDKIHITLEETRTARVFLCGPVNGRQKPVPYQGPELVLDFLKRTGALQPGCSDLQDVAIVRPMVALGRRPEVYRIDIQAIVLDNIPTSNIVVLPGDQVYVGETRRSSYSRVMPEWLQPLYRKLVGMLPADPAFWWPWGR